MSETSTRPELNHHRYIFLVRHRPFDNEEPRIDSFYELKMPAGITNSQMKMLSKLDERIYKEELAEDTSTYNQFDLRIRFNADMYPHVCLVRTTSPITADDLELIIKMKYRDGTLNDFLAESAIK